MFQRQVSASLTFVAIAAALTAITALSGCGGSDVDRLQAKAPEPRPYTARYPQDRGSTEDRTQVMELFREMQRLFYGGDAEAFCQRFRANLDALGELTPPAGVGRIEQCVRVVTATAKGVASGAVRWPRYVVRWVRVYEPPDRDAYAGVSSTSREAPLARMAFVRKGGRWHPDFRVPFELPGLSAR